jgi:hypothetical protein
LDEQPLCNWLVMPARRACVCGAHPVIATAGDRFVGEEIIGSSAFANDDTINFGKDRG